ncbi:D-2-hydroxyglutarate dehydrogenase, mitochondrial [Ancistrocladus abbreviatus]
MIVVVLIKRTCFGPLLQLLDEAFGHGGFLSFQVKRERPGRTHVMVDRRFLKRIVATNSGNAILLELDLAYQVAKKLLLEAKRKLGEVLSAFEFLVSQVMDLVPPSSMWLTWLIDIYILHYYFTD